MKKIVFVGAGSMAEAIIAGMVKEAVTLPKNITVMNKADDQRLIQLQNKYGVSIICPNKFALKEADLIVLATKPQDIQQALIDIRPILKENAAILSVVAGISIATIEACAGSRPIARSMPNTSATIGKSATGIAFNAAVTDSLKSEICILLEAIGLVQQVEEEQLHIVTALSGSGPAYIYALVEAFEKISVSEGLTKDVARSLTIQTLEGAAAMLKETGVEPSILRENVTSPNGTTAAGLRALADGKFEEIIANCIIAATERSKELAKETPVRK